MIKIDLHTHSTHSPDGGISAKHYKHILESGKLDCIAVTDHDDIAFAEKLQKRLGDKIIIGEEVTTTEGEIIGLFLKSKIDPHQSARKTAEAIKKQGGLVYVPHPFETARKGLDATALASIAELVDIIETYNARSLQGRRRPRAIAWAEERGIAMAASSDAHGGSALGRTFSLIAKIPDAKTLIDLLQHQSSDYSRKRVPLRGYLHPKLNRVKKRVTRRRKTS